MQTKVIGYTDFVVKSYSQSRNRSVVTFCYSVDSMVGSVVNCFISLKDCLFSLADHPHHGTKEFVIVKVSCICESGTLINNIGFKKNSRKCIVDEVLEVLK